MLTNEYLSWRRRRRVATVPLTGAHERAVEQRAVEQRAVEQRASPGDDLWNLLAELPRQQRVVLVLRYYEGLTDNEIADVMRCRASTVRAYASRALATLRVEITTDTIRNHQEAQL
jgi:RNA polymerase sigma factor (sigma-70 family)